MQRATLPGEVNKRSVDDIFLLYTVKICSFWSIKLG